MADATPTKRCSSCGTIQPHTMYNRATGGTSGVRSECRECARLTRRGTYQYTRAIINHSRTSMMVSIPPRVLAALGHPNMIRWVVRDGIVDMEVIQYKMEGDAS